MAWSFGAKKFRRQVGYYKALCDVPGCGKKALYCNNKFAACRAHRQMLIDMRQHLNDAVYEQRHAAIDGVARQRERVLKKTDSLKQTWKGR
jgi:hypothetical protein